MNMFFRFLILLMLALPLQADDRPNIVFILADDLGFTDIEPYGSEVSTPVLAGMAAEGVRFTNYHTAANCAPARAMLLTGVNNHLAGVANIPEMIAPSQATNENYQGVLGDNVVTVATLLESAGYYTYMAGKWHLGDAPGKRPSRRGFQRTVALMDSGADNWEQRPYLPIYTNANWFADGERFELPEDFYSSRFLVDKIIEFIEADSDDEKPFFAYLPLQAVHLPVQAPREYTERYLDVYDEGWEHLREQRRLKAIELGIVPDDVKMVRMDTTGDWESLDAERKRYESKRMAVYAGMIEAMDFHIGRLIEYLKQTGRYDNTIFVFTSDNGAEVSGPDNPQGFAAQRMVSNLGYNTDYETLGEKGSYSSISPSYASAAASPLAYYKFHTGEGGLRVPLIISGKPIALNPGITDAFTWATDIAPTILSLAEVAIPGERYAGKPVLPITGKNLVPLLKGEVSRVRSATEAVGYELMGHRALFQGDYKIVFNRPPRGDGEWHLYNIAEDPGETSDLKDLQPDVFSRMMAAYVDFEESHDVLPVSPGFSQSSQLLQNFAADRLRTPVIVLFLLLLVLVPFIVYRRMRSSV